VRRGAAVYRFRNQLILISPDSVTPVGLHVEQGPFGLLHEPVGDQELGEALIAALASAGQRVPHPTQEEFRALPRAIAKAAGARSWRQLVQASLVASVTVENHDIVTIPTDNTGSGSRGGFAHRPDEATRLSSLDPVAVGEAVRATLFRSRYPPEVTR